METANISALLTILIEIAEVQKAMVDLKNKMVSLIRDSPEASSSSLMESTDTVKRRGLASAGEETRKRVARSGGMAPHVKRGLQSVSQEIRIAVARKGGLARGAQRHRQLEEEEEQKLVAQTATTDGSEESSSWNY